MYRFSFFIFLILLFPLLCAAQAYDETGNASFYANKFQGRNCASGEKYDKALLTAAHRTLAFNTLVKVTNISNNLSVVVRVNDRGPNSPDRIIDLSRVAAETLGMIPAGVVKVRVEYVGMADADSVKQSLAALKAKRQAEAGLQKPVPENPGREVQKKEVQRVFYDRDQQVVKPRGYGVQVGIYKSYSECRNRLHEVETRYSVKACMLKETFKNGERYRLIVGLFGSRATAEDFRKNLLKEFPDCYTVSYISL